MQPNKLNDLLQKIDIYLLDQILKGSISFGMKILDAGCGSGRNCNYLLEQGFDVIGIDIDSNNIKLLQEKYSKNRFFISKIETVSFTKASFDYIICNAVLHFAKNEAHFLQMFDSLFHLLQPNGTLFIRMTSNIGIENRVVPIKDGVYKIPDGSIRFLLTRELFQKLKNRYPFTMVTPLKTVNVADVRCMTTMIIKKN